MQWIDELGLKEVTVEDYQKLKAFYMAFPSEVSDVSLINLMIWREKYRFHWCVEDGFLWIVNITDHGFYFSPPIGDYSDEVNLLNAIFNMKSKIEHMHFPFIMKKATGELAHLLNDFAETSASRDEHDYLYDFESMRTLPGNEYHKKKNLVNQFYKKYPTFGYKSYDVTDEHLVMTFLDEWCVSRVCESDPNLMYEYSGTIYLLHHLDQMPSVKAGVVYLDGKVIGLIIGEILEMGTLIVHIEKGNTQYTGIYQALGVLFYEAVKGEGIVWINREQDLGIEGLRQAKLSYHPKRFVEKFSVHFK